MFLARSVVVAPDDYLSPLETGSVCLRELPGTPSARRHRVAQTTQGVALLLAFDDDNRVIAIAQFRESIQGGVSSLDPAGAPAACPFRNELGERLAAIIVFDATYHESVLSGRICIHELEAGSLAPLWRGIC